MRRLETDRLHVVEREPIETTVFEIMQALIAKTNIIAREETQEGALFTTRSNLDQHIRSGKEKHLPAAEHIRTDKKAGESHRLWIIAERDHRERGVDLSIETEQKDSELRGLIMGKIVSIEPLAVPSENVFADTAIEHLEGRVVGVSALLGTLTVRSTDEQDVTAFLIDDRTDKEPIPQVQLTIIDE